VVTPAEVLLVLRPGLQSPRGHSAERLPLLAAVLFSLHELGCEEQVLLPIRGP
jgi:hypothetical protein